MALTYKDQVTLCADTAWVERVYACVCDVAQSVIVAADPGTASYAPKAALAAAVVQNKDAYAPAFARLTAAGFNVLSSLPTPLVDAGTDGQLKTLVTSAFDALVR